MANEERPNAELLDELRTLRARVAELEQREHEWQQTETALQKRRAELEKTSEKLDEILFMVMHDFYTPLTAIASNIYILQKHCADQIDEKGLKRVQIIAEYRQQLQDLVIGIIQYARISQTEAAITKIGVKGLLENIADKLNLREHAQVTFPDDAPVIQSKVVELEQIFSNLLSNAVKFQHPNTRPEIVVGWVDRDAEWEFSVSDNGIGIEEKYLKKIFGICQRLHMQSEYQGAGIGLAIAEKAVRQCGGQVWVKSVMGKGSTFSFTIPKPDRRD